MAHNLKAGIMATTTMVSAFAYSKTQNGVTDDEQASRMSGVNGQSHSGYGAQGGHSFVSTTYQCGSANSRNDKYQDTVQQMMHWKY